MWANEWLQLNQAGGGGVVVSEAVTIHWAHWYLQVPEHTQALESHTSIHTPVLPQGDGYCQQDGIACSSTGNSQDW